LRELEQLIDRIAKVSSWVELDEQAAAEEFDQAIQHAYHLRNFVCAKYNSDAITNMMSILRALKFLMATILFAAQSFVHGNSGRSAAADLLSDC
jgi:hypothetical protein